MVVNMSERWLMALIENRPWARDRGFLAVNAVIIFVNLHDLQSVAFCVKIGKIYQVRGSIICWEYSQNVLFQSKPSGIDCYCFGSISVNRLQLTVISNVIGNNTVPNYTWSVYMCVKSMRIFFGIHITF